MVKVLQVWLVAGLLILTGCHDAVGLNAEQLREIGLASLSVQYSAEAKDFFVESCDEPSDGRDISNLSSEFQVRKASPRMELNQTP